MTKCAIRSLGTHIKVRDIVISRAFYESLGFEPTFGYGDDEFRASLPEGVGSAPERYRGVTFTISDNANLEIAEGHIALKDQSVFTETILSTKVSGMVRVDSLVPLLDNPLVTITFPIRHYYWGTVEAAFRDPDGYVLVFIAPYSEKEVDAIRKYQEVEEMKPS